ncbi:hypothetical protein GCM10009555_040180 [Acrocarpospora macrocephala]|uniref:Uncharacterized protein n=1 Tax=Acrocarpospora macrocephala TaxID=150177 RepID=A0A5M3WPB4_9ACTN|nr:hypothetical protein [Acrocarpospora macrocephala]GES10009.1 hypothetical protein Amac_036050 [Acrocarpospora macrocephala]
MRDIRPQDYHFRQRAHHFQRPDGIRTHEPDEPAVFVPEPEEAVFYRRYGVTRFFNYPDTPGAELRPSDALVLASKRLAPLVEQLERLSPVPLASQLPIAALLKGLASSSFQKSSCLIAQKSSAKS